jgi:murein DD-endopeptidase MepM/ murein hydrolase activator NlpD
MRNQLLTGALLVSITIPLSSCGDGVPGLQGIGVCDGYTNPSTSLYKLPYTPGQTFQVTQGNCGGASHYGKERYSYDISMPIGTQLLAVRAGTVVGRNDGVADGTGCPAVNFIQIQHSDGTIANYVHLTPGGIQVAMGASVTQGQFIARSGNSGCSTGPHLHFSVYASTNGDSVPVTFSNTSIHPNGLRSGKSYTAQ